MLNYFVSQLKLSKIGYEEGTLENLEQQKNQLQNQRREIRQQLERKNGHRFELQYADPEPNFDRRRVKGRVCNLFDVNNSRDFLALSTCAGGQVCCFVILKY